MNFHEFDRKDLGQNNSRKKFKASDIPAIHEQIKLPRIQISQVRFMIDKCRPARRSLENIRS